MINKLEIQETILLVEDEVLVRIPIAQYLRDCGYKIIEAVNADEATVLLHKETVVDLVFSDIEMPGAVDGFGLAKWIREHHPGLDVLLAGTVRRAIENAKGLCEKGPIPKPYDARIVHDHIKQLLAAGKREKHEDEALAIMAAGHRPHADFSLTGRLPAFRTFAGKGVKKQAGKPRWLSPDVLIRVMNVAFAKADIRDRQRWADCVAKVTAERETRNNRIGAKGFFESALRIDA